MTRRHGGLGLLLAVLVAGVLTAGAAGAAPGDVTRVAGQGPDANCTSQELRVDAHGVPRLPQDDGTPPLADAKWSKSSNYGGIAVAGGRLYVAQGNRVRGPNGLVVGLAPRADAATDPDGAPATEVSLGAIEALAIHPAGGDLYLAERVQGETGVILTGQQVFRPHHARVWHVALGNPAPVLQKVATTEGAVGGLAADSSGRVFIAEENGTVSMATVGGAPVQVGTFASEVTSLAVDPSGNNLFATDKSADKVLHLNLAAGSGPVVIAGGSGKGDSGDNGLAPLARLDSPQSVAIDGLGVYFVDQPYPNERVRRIDLQTLVINTVVGPGAVGEAADLTVLKAALAVDRGNVYLGDFDNCQVLMIESAAAAAVPPVVNNPPAPPPPNNTGGTGGTGDSSTNTGAEQGAGAPNAPQGSSGEAGSAAPDPSGAGAGASGQNETGIISSTSGAPNETGIISSTTGAEGEAAPAPGPEGSAGGAETVAPSFQPSPNAPTAPAANPSPGPAPAPQPSPAPAPAPAPQPPAAPEALAAVDPGATASAPAEPAAVSGSALPAGAPQPAGNVAPAGADDAASRGAPRYAMVRSQEGGEIGAAAAMVGGALAVIFCVMLAGPRAVARPKPKPRPRGAY